jgi:hypothetical protein
VYKVLKVLCVVVVGGVYVCVCVCVCVCTPVTSDPGYQFR